MLRVCGKGTKVVLVPLPPAVGRAIDRAIGSMAIGPILLSSRGTRMDRHAATPPAPVARGVPVLRHHGRPTLNRQLRMGAFADLDQRSATRFTIKPMDLAESASYLRHLLALAR